ncbi:hypothetical protein TNCV_4215021 [Trichonephila clavipes]|nr:hypothetical protein TNCV_4215021 [Trichonephila clavipes]
MHVVIRSSSNPSLREFHKGNLARRPTVLYPIGERSCQCCPATLASTKGLKYPKSISRDGLLAQKEGAGHFLSGHCYQRGISHCCTVSVAYVTSVRDETTLRIHLP